MKTLIATSNSLRHRYFTQVVSRCIDTPIVLAEEKKNDYGQQCEQLLSFAPTPRASLFPRNPGLPMRSMRHVWKCV